MTLGSTQPLTEMSTRSISWGKGGRCVRLTTLPPSWAIVMKSGNLNYLETSRPFQACNGTDLPYIYTGCPRRKGPNFGRVFLRSNYTDITQNTYIQSSMVTEILAREKCQLLWCLRKVLSVTTSAWPSTRQSCSSCVPTLSQGAAHSDDLGYSTDVRSL